MKYNLSSNQADRINYDEANRIYISEALDAYLVAGGKLRDAHYTTWWNVAGDEDQNVDDMEEAETRFRSTFDEVVNALEIEITALELETMDSVTISENPPLR